MSKKKILIIEICLFILLLIGITVIYNYIINKNAEQSIQENNFLEEAQIIEIKNVEQFKQEIINEKGTVFVDFYATWCMPCKTMEPIIEEISKEHREVKFVKINIDENEELAIKYNVISIPTMFIMKNGEITKEFIGITNKENIIKEF